MASRLLELEGTWEEIMQQSPRLAGHRVRLILLDEDVAPTDETGFAKEQESFWQNPSAEEIFNQQGIQPVTDLASLLDSLPDMGPEADELWDIILDNRKQRRMAVHNQV
jgi:hypothetical protein